MDIVIWDNDALQAEYLTELYQKSGFSVVCKKAYREVHACLKKTPPSGVLVLNSQVLFKRPAQLKQLLKLKPTLAVIALILRQDLQARLEMLDLGALVCLQQPVNDQVLIAQSRALLNYQGRLNTPLAPVAQAIQRGPIRLHPDHASVQIKDQHIYLKPQAYRLFAYFCEYPNRLHTRSQLQQYLWQTPKNGSRHLDNLMVYLRQQLSEHDAFQLETVYGQGYILHL